MKYLWSEWPGVGQRILSANQRIFFLDFDGTLTPIVRKPQDAMLKKKTKEVLTTLSRSDKDRVVLVSGRSLKNLRALFRAKNVIYAGNHGLELQGQKFSLPVRARKAKKLAALVWLLAEKLKEDFQKVPGVLIEDKSYTLSVHYRNISREHLPFFKQEIDRFKKQYSHWPLVWRSGKKVWEVRPAEKWGKGELALYVAGKMPQALPIVIGDDGTDEDMFRALKHRGVTIRVGRSKKSQAEFYVNSSKDVRVFLERLSRANAQRL